MWWINFSEAASVSRIATASWDETYVRTPFYARQVVVTQSWAWLIGEGETGRIALDGSRASRTPMFTIDRRVMGATEADGIVWLYTGNLVGFDADTGRIVDRVRVNGFERPDAVAGVGVLGGRIWTSDPFRDRVVAVERA